MKKIAVITPVFNGEKFLENCINSVASSVLNKNFLLEHLLIDDGSTDNSWKAMQEFKFPHLKKFRFEKNKGQSAAMNFGVINTTAEYLFFIGVDDVLFQNSLNSLLQKAEQDNLDWIYGDFLRTDKNLSYLKKPRLLWS
ncbi:MAG: glycosyltransferase [Patescibacteria group bacterium]|nr:glycosyltransferase [Patescibacteria group bacterium]